ncbi:hypothetical protein C8R45DRAFT_560950 [Mycena sanguinolenta]|nr:hypothetical protein C8R45DRAFT_880102 [Mycena sanguinolenta]KAJ6457923.1 hypothetical protein C8R45DRAFT_560950 [Mycena sanguinolenta]
MTHNASDRKPPPPYDVRNMSETKKETAVSEPRYVYYRVYCSDGAIPAKTAFNPHNPYLGRIPARSVPPPHNAGTLNRCFVKAENIDDPNDSKMMLYRSPGASQALSATDKIALIRPGITDGATADSAFALVFRKDPTEEEHAAITSIDLASWLEEEPKYLYYRLFTRTGEDRSTVSFNLKDPALGRVDRMLVSPLHGPVSIKRHIAKVEARPIYAYSEFYKNLSAQETMADHIHLTLMQNNSVGLTKEDPIVLVQPERRPGLYNRPVKLLVQLNKHFPMECLAYTDADLVNDKYRCKRDNREAYLSPGNIPFPRPRLD